MTKSSSSDPQDTGLQSVANPPYWAPKAAVSLNLTIPLASVVRTARQRHVDLDDLFTSLLRAPRPMVPAAFRLPTL